ncbi:MAG: hypothetical protein CV089_21895 [Nitrospira sp. WS110]|nr:hypothetical protein [Nitrospira sp. WS110]
MIGGGRPFEADDGETPIMVWDGHRQYLAVVILSLAAIGFTAILPVCRHRHEEPGPGQDARPADDRAHAMTVGHDDAV